MKHYGFNFQWMAAWQPGQKPEDADQSALDFLAEFGFNFVRIPLDYRYWIHNFDYFHVDEACFRSTDSYLQACRSRGIHLSLNLHRAPGYCTNRNELERHNLWRDEIAQNAFVYLWDAFATRYRGIPREWLSFNLINEPPNPGSHGMTRQNHAALIRRTAGAVHAIDPQREIVIDGPGGGYLPMPELAGLGVTHSGRGYHPMPVTHHRASWWRDHEKVPAPKYPGLRWQGRVWERRTLRESYKPWRDVEKRGVKIHIGEFGCFKHTPDHVARRWYEDILHVYKEFGWGYALWQFQGPFGIVQHGRPGAVFHPVKGYAVDRFLLELLLENRAP